jgi:hypothetical protein
MAVAGGRVIAGADAGRTHQDSAVGPIVRSWILRKIIAVAVRTFHAHRRNSVTE